jgi:hypothetical protein
MKAGHLILGGFILLGLSSLTKKKRVIENDLKGVSDNWFKINEPSGKMCGYPDCCIREFGNDSPESLKKRTKTKDDVMRYNAGCVNGKFTGFIPCKEHAKQIISGKITLASLIKNRDINLPKFPNALDGQIF